MRQFTLLPRLLFTFMCFLHPAYASDLDSNPHPPPLKEWTLLVYLNGNNSLDSFGPENISQMEHVGSTDQLNIVVQWASLTTNKTQRLYVTQNTKSTGVTSPILEDLSTKVDMGDWHSLVEFVRWGVAHFPAKHYFIDVWDHGSGWHAIRTQSRLHQQSHITDISWDDNTGHAINTIDLGRALSASAQIIGHKVDVYASDACLMAMAEIADQMADSVEVFSGSEELEPGPGWPYEPLLRRWTSQPKISSREIASILTEEYIKSYTGGINGNEDATFSSFDLTKIKQLNSKIAAFGRNLMTLRQKDQERVIQIASKSQTFTYSDYVDLMDFLVQLEKEKISGLHKTSITALQSALKKFIISNGSSPNYTRAGGLAIWIPTTLDSYDSFASEYKQLKFNSHTQWAEVLRDLLK